MIDWIVAGLAVFFVFWWGYFTGATMATAKRSDEQADAAYEHIRRPEL